MDQQPLDSKPNALPTELRLEMCGVGFGLNIRTLASPKIGQDQVSRVVSVPCLHATPVADALWKPIFGEMSDSVRMLSPVIMSQTGIMSNRYRV